MFVEGIASGRIPQRLNPQMATLALLGLCNSVIAARALPHALGIDDFIEEYSRIVIDGTLALSRRSDSSRR